ncbi:UDP-N-acetylmuramate dehydrogenase [Glaciecola sp. SC05]|uniref:UDP-N-acetylmuramate dehydrogenase n=1 Tax=Glaciecola sp. SC05 TaxID=1987355 RepID=UPI003527F847
MGNNWPTHFTEVIDTVHPLTSLHTFGLEAYSDYFTTIDSLDSLLEIASSLSEKPYLLLGDGSNTIFVDDFEGMIVKNALKGIHISEDDDYFHLNVASGENWHDLVCLCTEKGIYGFENLALIPGTVGASPIQNIGAYGVEIEKFVHSVEFLDITTQMMGYFNKKECEFAYRDSRFKREPGKRVITSVNFAMPKNNLLVTSYGPLAELNNPNPRSVFDAVIAARNTKLPDPHVLGNAGSFFKNPTIGRLTFEELKLRFPELPHYNAPEGKVKIPAAWLIDQLGFKGSRVGDIGCHEHQALVLVNHGGGKAEDLLRLARDIKSHVLATFGIKLENEVRLMGKQGKVDL